MQKTFKLWTLVLIVTCAIFVGYVIGSYRAMITTEKDFYGYQVALNSMYLLILQQKGQESLDKRIVVQLDTAVKNLDKPTSRSLHSFVYNILCERSTIRNKGFSYTYATALKDFKSHYPDTAFSDETNHFIEKYTETQK